MLEKLAYISDKIYFSWAYSADQLSNVQERLQRGAVRETDVSGYSCEASIGGWEQIIYREKDGYIFEVRFPTRAPEETAEEVLIRNPGFFKLKEVELTLE